MMVITVPDGLGYARGMTHTLAPALPSQSAPTAAPLSLGPFGGIELRHLAALDAVAEEGTFGKAAERLGYTQSAVSQQIGTLEKVLGGAVFDRPGGPRPVRITPLGKVVLAHARDLLARAAASADAIERFRAGEGGRIDIGTFQSVSSALLPAMVRRLREEFAGADIRLHEAENTNVAHLLDGQLDVLFTVAPTRNDLVTRNLHEDPFVLVARRGEFPNGAVDMAALDGLQMVQYPPDCDLNRIGETLQSLGVRPVPVFESADNGTVVAMVRAGLGPAVSAMLCLDIRPDDPQIQIHPLRPKIPPRRIQLAWLPNRTLSPLASRFIEIAQEVSAELAPDTSEFFARG